MPNQPRSSNGDVSSLPHGKILSSASIRKAKYAERDRARAVDPGALYFASIDEEEEEEEKTIPNQIAGERGRNLALRILKAQNELPEDGTRSMV